MRFLLVFLFVFIVSHISAQVSYREEFNGPFASWANAKTRFKAAGDGIKDDTKALQTAIDSLSVFLAKEYNTNARTSYLVLYLPAGVYKISATLRVEGKIGFTIIGEDPAKTIIKWAGNANDTMMVMNGSSYYKIGRLTWDASKIKNIEAVGVHWLEKQKGLFAATSVELSDMIFTGGFSYGIFGGTNAGEGVAANDAEVAIKRCRFLNCTGAGIAIKGYNSLDYWIWDCTFNDCTRGVQCSLGNYHLYNSTFYRSSETDIFNEDGYYTSVRGCYSKDSRMFSFDKGASCNAFKRIFQGNTLEGFKVIPIEYHSQGRITLLDNAFYRNGLEEIPMVNYSSWCPAMYQVLSVGNYFEEPQPVYTPKEFTKQVFTSNNAISLKAKNIKPAPPPPPPVPFLSFIKRKVFEVPAGASAKQIQDIINEAAKWKGQRPIVHFPLGTYILEKEIVVPAEADIQIIGDGILYATVFKKKAGSADQYCFDIKGPTYVTLQHFQIDNRDSHDQQNGILFENIDQQKAEVHIDQINTQVQTTLYTDRLNYTYIEKNNSFFSSGHQLIGGDKMKSGKGSAVLYCFGGQSARTTLQNASVMVAKDCWWEGASKKEYLPLDLNGDGRFTLDGAMISPRDLDSTATIRVNNFKGKVTISDLYMYGGIDVNNSINDLKVLIWNANLIKKQDAGSFVKNNFKPAMAMLGVTTQCYKTDPGGCKNDNILSSTNLVRNVPSLDSFLDDMTADLRTAVPRTFRNLDNKVSNVYIYRVAVTGGNTAFRFQQ